MNSLRVFGLPAEIIVYIFQFLDLKSIVNLELICKKFQMYSRDSLVWKSLFQRTFGFKIPPNKRGNLQYDHPRSYFKYYESKMLVEIIFHHENTEILSKRFLKEVPSPIRPNSVYLRKIRPDAFRLGDKIFLVLASYTGEIDTINGTIINGIQVSRGLNLPFKVVDICKNKKQLLKSKFVQSGVSPGIWKSPRKRFRREKTEHVEIHIVSCVIT